MAAKARKRKFPWKQNLRKIPNHVRQKLTTLPDNITVAAALKIPESSIRSGVFEHLNIVWGSGEPQFDAEVLPQPDVGKWSATNVHGHDIVRTDLPMTTKTFGMETPNWGDWSKGSHTVYWDREVYQRENIPPKQLMIKVSLVGEEPAADSLYVFKFEADEVLSKSADSFEPNLFYALNLLQENIGRADVVASETPIEDYLKTLYVGWEILPPGERESNIATIIRVTGATSEAERGKIKERLEVFYSLKPRHIILGTSGFRRYYGAVLEDDLVVFENAEYGNAIYVMGEDWQRLTQLSRIKLLAMTQREDFTRIPHMVGWKGRLRTEIRQRRGQQQ